MARTRMLGNEPRPKYVMLKKALWIGLYPAQSPLGFLPGCKRTAEIKCQSCCAPEHRGDMKPHQCRPPQNEKTSEHDERDVGAVGEHEESSEGPVNHRALWGGAIHNFPSGNCPAWTSPASRAIESDGG